MAPKIATAIAGLLVAGMLLSGCELLTPPGPVEPSENIGSDASGSEVVTATKDADAIRRHLQDPSQADQYTLVTPKSPSSKAAIAGEEKAKAEAQGNSDSGSDSSSSGSSSSDSSSKHHRRHSRSSAGTGQ